jgi:hypothetical protein
MIQFTCPCGKLLQARPEHAGQRTRCPRCERELDIPRPDTAFRPAAPAEAGDERIARALPPHYPEDDEEEVEDRPRRKQPGTSGKAVASMILGVLGIVPCSVFAGIPALVLGLLGLSEVRASGGRLRGRGLAITGVVLGSLSLVLGIVAIPVALIFPAFQKLRDAESRTQSSNNLKRIGIALHNYHDTYGQFPPAIVYNANGQPLYSWRVLILPYLEQQNLYQQFKLDEPWDSPHNSVLSQTVLKVYTHPSRSLPPGTTVYLGFNGKDTLFESDPSVGLDPLTNPAGRFQTKNRIRIPASIPDGTSNTILVAEAADPVPWAKPEDLPYAADRPLPKLGDPAKRTFLVLVADGSVRTLQKSISEQTLRAAITKSDGQVLGPDW